LRLWNDINDRNDPLYQHAFTFDPDKLDENETVLSAARRAGESIIKANDTVYYTIKVTDGELFGTETKSDVITVVEDIPTVDVVQVKARRPNGTISSKLTAGDTAIVQFNLLADSNSNSSLIRWIVNDEIFKQNFVGEKNADTLRSGEASSTNVVALTFNNEIKVEIVPDTGGASGDAVTSESVIVQNAVPIISFIQLAPATPTAGQDLFINYVMTDSDIDVNADPNQEDQTTIKWFRSVTGREADFTEVTSLQNKESVTSSHTEKGDIWKAQLTPFDSLEFGQAVDSNVVIIR
jgi:hypothetical protein